LSQRALSAAVPATLRDATTGTALQWATGQALLAGAASEPVASLTTGVLRSMFLAKLRTVALVVLVLGVFGLGAGLYARWSPGQQPGTPEVAAADPEKQPGRDPAPGKKTFENEFGYTWWKEPEDVSDYVAARPNTEGRWTLTVTHGKGEADP